MANVYAVVIPRPAAIPASVEDLASLRATRSEARRDVALGPFSADARSLRRYGEQPPMTNSPKLGFSAAVPPRR